MLAREPTDVEGSIFERFAEVDIPAKNELRQQLANVRVIRETEGFWILDARGPQIKNPLGFPVDGWYKDPDGALVFLILHLALPEGRISSLERYRPDGKLIMNKTPSAAQITVQPATLDGPDQGASFDAEGWKRIE